MMKNRISVTADCTSDLSDELLKKYSIETIYFNIVTGTGCFRDLDEITALNVLELIENGETARSLAPDIDECIKFFTEKLETCEELIHITISSQISRSYMNCCEALKIMGDKAKRIKILDSENLSTGTGHLAIRASKLAAKGESSDAIIKDLSEYRKRVSTSFLVRNADYLYANGKVGKKTKKICDILDLHPILQIKNGKICLKFFRGGEYEKAQINYVRSEIKKPDIIDKDRIFITHSGCSVKTLEAARNVIEEKNIIKNIYITEASATVSSNCGPGTIGIIYIRK